MIKKIKPKIQIYILSFILLSLFFLFIPDVKVEAAMCPSSGPVTSEWTTDNKKYVRTVYLPTPIGPIYLNGYIYDFWFKLRTNSQGKEVMQTDCDNVSFEFNGQTRYVKDITFKAHDHNDTGGFEIYMWLPNDTYQRIWQNLDLNTKDGCLSTNDCYADYTVGVNATVKGILFVGKHDETEHVYLDFGSVRGFDCPTNQTYSCSADGTKATLSWNSVNNASGYDLRIDRNAPSWFGSEDTSDINTTLNRTFDVVPNIKNSFSVQAIGPGEAYPYNGNMCWQEFTCKSTLPPNSLPTCSSIPIILSPNKTTYLPDSQVSITAQGYSDIDNDPLTITNWQVTKGTIVSTSSDSKNIVLKMPSTNNETVIVSYVVSDGKSNVTCTSPASTYLTTVIKYSCGSNQCAISDTGFDTEADCIASCPGAQNKYSCNSNGQCIYDPTNGTYPSSNCDNACAPAAVSCENINVQGSLTDGSQVLLSANVKNFPVGGAQSTYQWVSQYGTIDISADTNCDQSTKICNMQLNKAYTTAQVKYNVPISDTVYFKVNGNTVSSCTLNVNNTSGKDITLQFDKDSYNNVSTGPNSNTVLLQTTPLNNFSSYFLKLTCIDKSTNLPCPAGSFRFNNTTETDKTTKLLSSLTANTTYNDYVYLNFANPVQITLRAEGNIIPSTPSLYRTDTADVTITKPSLFTMSVVYTGDGVYKNTKSEYCNTTYTNPFKQVIADFENTSTSTSNTYDLESVTPPSSLVSGLYNLSLSLKPSVEKKELKCIKVNGNIFDSSSVSLNSDGSNISVYAVVGPTEGNTWYQAFGGSAYSKLGITSNIEDTTASVLNTIGNIWAGILQSSKLIVGNGISPDKYVIAPAASSFMNAKDISELQTELDAANLTKINSLSSVSKSADVTNFYYFSNASNRLDITSDFKVDSGKMVPIVFVQGDVSISNSVKQIDMYIIATGTINVGTDSSIVNDMVINGGLLSKNNIKFNSLNVVQDINGKLTEKIYYKPSIYFSNSLNSLYFKNINIYTNLID